LIQINELTPPDTATFNQSQKMRHHLSRLITGTALVVSGLPALAADLAADDNPIGRFEIVRFEVQGSSLVGRDETDRLLAPFTGKDRDFGHVQRALEALEEAYQKIGYNLVKVTLPEQELNQGVVRFMLIETKVNQVSVTGNRYFDEANIRNSLPGLREGLTPNIGKISSSLKLANENPSKKINLQLQSGDRDDEVNATLNVDDERAWRIGVSLDNTGNDSTGDTHVGVLLQHANVGGRDQVLTLQYTTTLQKPSNISVYGAGYHIPLYALGDSVDLFASYSDVDSGSLTAGILNLQVSGRGSVYGARYNQNLRRVGDYDSRIIYGIDYKDYRNNVTLEGAQLGNDVTVRPLSVAYAGNWSLSAGQADISVTALRNLPGGDRGGQADFDRIRAGAPANYSMLRYAGSFSHALPADWMMRLNLNGQYSNDALVPGEQFGAGGGSTVRGFDEREVANDSGHLVSAEIYTPNLCAAIKAYATQCRALAFYDTARVRRNNALSGEATRASIGSVGFGLRVAMDRYLTLQMDVGHVVDGGVASAKGDNKLHFRLGFSY
jgi:hemolysin activation/secretion protein